MDNENHRRSVREAHQPVGLIYDVLHEIRRAKRILNAAEKRIMKEYRAEKRRRRQSYQIQRANLEALAESEALEALAESRADDSEMVNGE